ALPVMDLQRWSTAISQRADAAIALRPSRRAERGNHAETGRGTTIRGRKRDRVRLVVQLSERSSPDNSDEKCEPSRRAVAARAVECQRASAKRLRHRARGPAVGGVLSEQGRVG